MHIDFVPYVVQPDGTEAIINRDNNNFERTDPAAFTQWMREQDDIASKQPAQGHPADEVPARPQELVHRHEVDHPDDAARRAGQRREEAVDTRRVQRRADRASHDRHRPRRLATLQFAKPHVADPSGTGLDFDHRWNDESFYYFKARINVHAQQIRDAYDEDDFDESVKKWQDLFGDGFKARKPSSSSKFGGAGGAAATGRAG